MDISLFVSRSELFMERNAVLDLARRINYITHEKAGLHVRILPEEDDYTGMIAGSLPEAAGENLLPDAGLTVFLIGDEVWGAVRSALMQAVRRRRDDPDFFMVTAIRGVPEPAEEGASALVPRPGPVADLCRQLDREDAPYVFWQDGTDLWLAILLMLESHPLRPLGAPLTICNDDLRIGSGYLFDFTQLPRIRGDRLFRKYRSDRLEEESRHNHWDWRYNSDEYDEAVYERYDAHRDQLIRSEIRDLRNRLRITPPKEAEL